jgi:ABC-2 type transport system permease protein
VIAERSTVGDSLAHGLAVARRDLVIELSYPFNMILRYAQVLFWCLTLYFIAKLIRQPPELRRYGGDYFGFALIGISVSTVVGVALGGFGRSVTDEQKAGTLELLLATPIRLATLMAGSVAVPIGIAVTQIGIYLASGWLLFDLDLDPGGLLLMIPVLLLGLIVFGTFGALSAAFVVLTKRGDPFTVLLTQMSTLVAGAIFPVAVLPGAVQAIAKVLPAYYVLHGLRETLLLGAGLGDIVGDLLALTGFAIVLIPVSVWVFGRAVAAARVTGTLGNY